MGANTIEKEFEVSCQLYIFGPMQQLDSARKLNSRLEKIPVRHIQPVREPSLLGDLTIRTLAEMLDGKDLVQPIHRHDFFYLLALENGSGAHKVDFTPYQVTDYSLFFLRPGQVHALELSAESDGYLMQFSTDFYFPSDKASLGLLRKASRQGYYQMNSESYEKISSILQAIHWEYNTKKDGYNIAVKSNMDLLLVELARHQCQPMGNKNLHQQEKFDKFIQLLEQHILTNKQVSYYARLMNISPYQLNSITKATLGKTCSELIYEQVILEAKRCILATSNQISQTAYRLGFTDVSYFIRFFKKHTGHTPETYRQNFS
jgi:AraC-like DNA-binding protein